MFKIRSTVSILLLICITLLAFSGCNNDPADNSSPDNGGGDLGIKTITVSTIKSITSSVTAEKSKYLDTNDLATVTEILAKYEWTLGDANPLCERDCIITIHGDKAINALYHATCGRFFEHAGNRVLYLSNGDRIVLNGIIAKYIDLRYSIAKDYDCAIDVLKETYPQCFGLNDENGLTVCVYQMAPASYRFCLLDKARGDITYKDLIPLWHGTNIEEMKTILGTYDKGRSGEFEVLVFHHPLSSYIGTADSEHREKLEEDLKAELQKTE